ncbi:MAG: hypothetical protein H0X50_10015 [Nitrosopumilus sp.]|nr:hypothetical protein [Nitrosopumilus sp.]
MNNHEIHPIKNPTQRTLKKIIVIDPKSFVTYKVKDKEAWSWYRKKSEKWFIHYDSNTHHLRVSRME